MKEREIWLDYLRAFACILVSLGHLFLSFQEASIRDTQLISYGIDLIYHFHVYIFFFCSGYLLQKSFQRYADRKLFVRDKILRSLEFLIVYILFSGVTFVIKTVLSDQVNSPTSHSFLAILLKYPINQMWYLYAICVITLFTPMIKPGRTINVILCVSLIMKIVVCIPACDSVIPLPFRYLFQNQIWYVMGSLWADKKIVVKNWLVAVMAVAFVAVSTVAFFMGVENAFLDMLLTFTGILVAVELCRRITEKKTKMFIGWKLVAKYMLQIYLLHTIFAAGIRIVLLRLGITDFWIHLPFGIIFSLAPPVVCGVIAERIKLLNIFFYPVKTIRKKCK